MAIVGSMCAQTFNDLPPAFAEAAANLNVHTISGNHNFRKSQFQKITISGNLNVHTISGNRISKQFDADCELLEKALHLL